MLQEEEQEEEMSGHLKIMNLNGAASFKLFHGTVYTKLSSYLHKRPSNIKGWINFTSSGVTIYQDNSKWFVSDKNIVAVELDVNPIEFPVTSSLEEE